jgi:WD40 repeat protein
VHFSPDDKRVVTAGFTDGVVQVWDAESGQEILHIDAHPGSRVYQAVFSPAGDRIATSSADNTVKTWDANTGQELFTISGFGEGSIADGLFPGVLDVAFSPDGNKLATASGDGVAKVWDSRTGIELFSLDGDTSALSRVQFSPDGSLIATASEEPDATARLSIFDANSGSEIWRQTVQQFRIWGLAFDSKGERIVTAGAGGVIKIWETATGQELMDIPGYAASAGDAVFSPDGSLLAIVGGDGLQVWNVETKDKVLDLPIHSSWIWAVSFTNDGSKLATASTDGTTRVIYINVDDLIAHAKSRLTRSLTTAECQQYLHVESCPSQP